MVPISVHRRLLAALAVFALSLAPLRAAAGDVTIFAAASLADALGTIGDAWEAETGNNATFSFAGSSTLARQIQEGAPADIFISASTDWMDAVEGSSDIREDTRRDLLGNTLVLIAHGRDAAAVTIDAELDLLNLLGDGRLAMAMIDSVPAGIYGKEALTALGLWSDVEPRVIQADNVRAALAFVARNETPYGIVYATDAAVQDEVSIVGTFPAGSHEPITYPAAITAQNTSTVTESFLDHLSSESARVIWEQFGFTVLD